jgi:hypothetical protein
MGEEAESASDTELEAELQRLQTRITEVWLWCRGLEEQLAQLAAVLAVVAPDLAGLGLTRFPLGAALPDQFPIHGQQ